MKRTLFALIAAVGLVGFAAAATASTISVTTNAAIYTVGQTITLTVTGNSTGNTAGPQVRVIVLDSPLVTGLGGGVSGTFTQFNGGAPATVGAQQGKCEWAAGRTDQCLIFDQIFGVAGSPADAGDKTGVMTYTADIAGIANFSFQDAAGSDFIFFAQGNGTDIGTAPGGLSVTIVPIPEPTTAALLGLGLFGLALGGRRRS